VVVDGRVVDVVGADVVVVAGRVVVVVAGRVVTLGGRVVVVAAVDDVGLNSVDDGALPLVVVERSMLPTGSLHATSSATAVRPKKALARLDTCLFMFPPRRSGQCIGHALREGAPPRPFAFV
jgi:hypothetical protein